nr:hypothetical protein [Tanacetum cinerariifolium]
EVSSFDGPEPQPLLNSPSLDVSLEDVIGPKPPIKPHGLDSSRMKVVDYLTTQTPPLPHMENSHPKGFMRPFGCPVTILNTLNPLDNFDGKTDEGFLVGYSNTDADTTFEVKELESKVHVSPSSSAKTKKHDDKTTKEAKGKSPVELSTGVRNLSKEFEDFSDNSTNEVNAASTPVPTVGQNTTNNTNTFSATALKDITCLYDEEDVGAEADFSNLETNIIVSPILTTRVHKDHHVSQIIGDLSSAPLTRSMIRMVKDQGGLTQINNEDFHTCMFACFLSQEEPKRVWVLVDLPKGKRAIGSKLVFKNKNDERGIVIRNKARLVAQGHTQDEGIYYEEVFDPVARIEAIRLFLAYASFMRFMVNQMDVKSAFFYETIEEDVYVCQPLGFEDPDYPDKRGKIDQTLFIKKKKSDILLVQVYVDDIIFGSTNKDLCKAFEKLMKDKFRMSSMGELTFFLGFQVKQKQDGIFISQDKYVAKILRKFGLTDGKSASTPIDTEKPLLKDPDGEDVDVYTYRYLKGKPHLGLWYHKDSPFNLVAYFDSDYAGASLDRKSTTRGCQFLGCRLISWQCKKQTVVATSSTEAEYVATASCCAQVQWIQNQLLDYGLIITAVSSKLLLFGLRIDDVHLMLLDHKTNDIVRLRALINRRKVIITEDTIRQVLHMDDTDSIDCLPNEEIFAELARMGSSMASAVICLATGRKFNFSKYIFDGLVRNMDSSSKFYMYPRFLQLMIDAQVGDLSSHTTKYTSPALTQEVFANVRRVGKGFYGVDTPSFEGILVPQPVNDDVADDVVADAAEPTLPTPATTPPHPQELILSTLQVTPTSPPSPHQSLIAPASSPLQQQQHSQTTNISTELLNTLLETFTTLTRRVKNLEQDKIAQALEITKLKQRVRRLEKKRKRMHLNKGEIVELDAYEDVTLEEVAAEVAKDAEVQGSLEESQAHVYHIDLEHADKVLKLVTAAATTIIAAPITAALSAARRRKGVVIRDPKETATPSVIVHSEPKSKDKEKGILELEEEASKAIKKKSETSKEKAAKKQKLDEEVEELKTHLQIVSNDKGDVYTEATPLALKVPVVDYQIHTENNKPYYKIIRADGTHQLFLSFISLLRNFDREDLEMLWQIIQERFTSSKPKNFSNDFLLNTLKMMFEKPNVEAQTYNCCYKLKLLDNAAGRKLRLLEESAAADEKMKELH